MILDPTHTYQYRGTVLVYCDSFFLYDRSSMSRETRYQSLSLALAAVCTSKLLHSQLIGWVPMTDDVY